MDYVALAAKVKYLTDKYGREITLSVPGAPDSPSTPWRNTDAYTTLATVRGVFVPPQGLGFGSEAINDDMLQRVSEVCLVGYGGTDLSIAKVLTDGIDFRVEWCYPLKPGPIPLLYAFGIKR